MADPVAMTITPVGEVGEEALEPALQPTASPKSTKDFGATLKGFISEVDGLHKASDQAVKDFASGKVEDVHEVMVAMNKADLSFRMVLEIRNKIVEAYQEVMRLTV